MRGSGGPSGTEAIFRRSVPCVPLGCGAERPVGVPDQSAVGGEPGDGAGGAVEGGVGVSEGVGVGGGCTVSLGVDEVGGFTMVGFDVAGVVIAPDWPIGPW